MNFDRAVPQYIRENWIPNILGWIPIPTPGTRAYLISQVKDVVRLSYGEVAFVTPPHIREAAKEAIDAGHTHYAYLPELREAIAEKLWRDNHFKADPGTEIIVSSGCHSILAQVFTAFVGPGDEVIMGTPDMYYGPNTLVHGGTPVMIPLREERGFHLDPKEVEAAITPGTKIIAITSPDGPTGAVHRREDLEQIAELAIRHDLLVVSDEIYEKINFGRVPHTSIASLPGMQERTVTVNGFSKGYAMTGWRVGYAVVPKHLMLAVRATNALHTIKLNTIAQYAAIAAYQGPQEPINEMVAEYKRRMTILVDGINAIDGLHCIFPDGTYYAWVNVSSLGLDSGTFATHCLLSEGVHVSPGSSFGLGGESYVRTSCSSSEETMREGLRRLERAVARLKHDAPVLDLPE